MKSLAERAEALAHRLKGVGATSGLKEKANQKKTGGIKSSKEDGQEERKERRVHFRAEVQMHEL
jgi:hypothetical protein